jgi:V8-like Glu-specific endopeptidase
MQTQRSQNYYKRQTSRPEALPTRAICSLLIVVLIAVVGFSTSAQGDAFFPTTRLPYRVDSGIHDGTAEDFMTPFRDVVWVPDAPWLRLHVEAHSLGPKSYVTLTSLEDGGLQRLDAEGISRWDNYTAYFNGEAVMIELSVAPGEKGVSIVFDEALAGVPPGAQTESPRQQKLLDICGDEDNRIASNDTRVGRLRYPGGGVCTGWLIPEGIVLTAGHCGDGDLTGVMMEFNVPPSDSNGSPNDSSPEYQYPANTSHWVFQDNGPGEDFKVFTLYPNTETFQYAHDVQGFFWLTTNVPLPDNMMRVTGYGIDPYPPGDGCCTPACEQMCNADSLTQQTAIGRLDQLSGTTLEYEVDTMGGDSGGPVISENNGFTVGIHNAGGCQSAVDGYENHGTWFGYAELQDAIRSFLPPGIYWVEGVSTHFVQTGDLFLPFKTVSTAVDMVPNGAVVKIVGGNYTAAAGNTFVAGANGNAMTLMAVIGDAVIGN